MGRGQGILHAAEIGDDMTHPTNKGQLRRPNPRDLRIVTLINQGLTFNGVGSLLGISGGRVSALYKKAAARYAREGC